jgi:hypothetical protein
VFRYTHIFMDTLIHVTYINTLIHKYLQTLLRFREGHIFRYMHTCIHTFPYLHHTHTRVWYIHTHTYIHMNAHIHRAQQRNWIRHDNTWVHGFLQPKSHTHMYVHTYIHTWIHTYTEAPSENGSEMTLVEYICWLICRVSGWEMSARTAWRRVSYVCMCIYVVVFLCCPCLSLFLCMYVCACINTLACMSMYTYMCMCLYEHSAYINTHTCVYMCVVCMYKRMCVYVHV